MKEILETICRYLQNWDPLDVIDDLITEGLPPDKYDIHSGSLYTLLASGANEEAIYKYLVLVIEQAGLKVNEERERAMTRSLYKYFHKKSGLKK